mmetsp:Transcript_70741/g.165945  ORF Transcript_70741/g.165945 Transcript_70741/m.165945 type:complete len:299 (-) Transcript_70741:559-1455(-)
MVHRLCCASETEAGDNRGPKDLPVSAVLLLLALVDFLHQLGLCRTMAVVGPMPKLVTTWNNASDQRCVDKLCRHEHGESFEDLHILLVKLSDFVVKFLLVDHLNDSTCFVFRRWPLDWNCNDAMGVVTSFLIVLRIKSSIFVRIIDDDQLVLCRALACDASSSWYPNFLCGICRMRDQLACPVIHQEHGAAVCIHQCRSMGGDRKDQGLCTETFRRQGLQHLQQSICTLAGHNRSTIKLCVMQSNRYLVCQISKQNLVYLAEAFTSVPELVDSLDDSQAGILKVDDRHGQQALRLVSC